MALTVTTLKRTFTFEREHSEPIILADINSQMTPQSVMDFYAGHYPELTTGVVEGPIVKADAVEYKFVTKLGTKG